MALRILRGPVVDERTGEARSTRYDKVKKGLLTRPIKLGARSSGWPEHEIDAIVAARIAAKTDDEIRALVDHLHAARTVLTASPPAGVEEAKNHHTKQHRRA